MGDTLFARLFANPSNVKKEGLTTEQAVAAPWSTPQTSEELLDYLLGPGERPIVIFPIMPPEIEAVLPKAGSAPGFKLDGGEAL